jgi:hypothetical protein
MIDYGGWAAWMRKHQSERAAQAGLPLPADFEK